MALNSQVFPIKFINTQIHFPKIILKCLSRHSAGVGTLVDHSEVIKVIPQITKSKNRILHQSSSFSFGL